MESIYNTETAAGYTDEQLVAVAQTGSDEALAELIVRFEPMVQMQAAKFCRFDLAKEDLAQEGLLAILSAVNGFDSQKGVLFGTFASVCVRNRMVSVVRKHSSEGQVSLDEWEDDTAIIGEEQEDPASMLIQRYEDERLMQHLKTVLTDLEYQVLVHRLASYSYAEIADLFEVSEKSVDNAMQRVRRKLTVGNHLPDIISQ